MATAVDHHPMPNDSDLFKHIITQVQPPPLSTPRHVAGNSNDDDETHEESAPIFNSPITQVSPPVKTLLTKSDDASSLPASTSPTSSSTGGALVAPVVAANLKRRYSSKYDALTEDQHDITKRTKESPLRRFFCCFPIRRAHIKKREEEETSSDPAKKYAVSTQTKAQQQQQQQQNNAQPTMTSIVPVAPTAVAKKPPIYQKQTPQPPPQQPDYSDQERNAAVIREQILAGIQPTKYLLPRNMLQAHANKKTLVLDLDETLVHSSFRYVKGADFVIPVEIDGTVHDVYVCKRPGVDEFMLEMGKLFEVVVFTASLSKYADPVLDELDIHHVVTHRLFRESCSLHQGNYVKDLSLMGRRMDQILIIDNSHVSYMLQPENALPITSWFDDPDDTELEDMIPFLEQVSRSDSVYTLLKNYSLSHS